MKFNRSPVWIVFAVFFLNACKPDASHLPSFGNESPSPVRVQNPLDPTSFFTRSHLEDPADYRLGLQGYYRKYEAEMKGFGIYLSFKNNNLVVHGKEYPPYPWKSNFERELDDNLNDLNAAKLLASAFAQHIQPLLNKDHNTELEDAIKYFIKDKEIFLGSSLISLKSKMEDPSLQPFLKEPKYIQAWEAFMNEVNKGYPKLKPQTPHHRSRVVIITGPYGAGHGTTATVFLESAKLIPGIEAFKVDECDEREIKNDPKTNIFQDSLFIATGYNACRIYNDIQVGGENDRKAELLYGLNARITEYIPKNKFGLLYEKVKELEPDLIISTVHHVPEVMGLASKLDVPLRVAVTDYSFPYKQFRRVNDVDPPLISYWIPSQEKEFFREFIRTYVLSNDDQDYPNSFSRSVFEGLFLANRPLEEIPNASLMFQFMPYPVSTVIEPPKDENDTLENRASLGLSTDLDRKVLTLALGGSPKASTMIAILEKLLRLEHEISAPTELAIVSAGLDEVADKVKIFLDKNKIPVVQGPHGSERREHLLVKIFTHRLKYPEEMANLYKASDLFISKTGGATTAEAIYSSTPILLGFGLWPWEIENIKYLEKLGLSVPPPHHALVEDLLHEDLSHYQNDPDDRHLLAQINTILSRSGRLQVNVPRFHPSILGTWTQSAIASFRDFKRAQRGAKRQAERFVKAMTNIVISRYPNLKLLSKNDYRSDAQWNDYLFSDSKKNWIAKIAKEDLPHNQINNTIGVLQRLHEIIPENVVEVRPVSGRILLKEFISGRNLFEVLRDSKMTQEMSHSLFNLFEKLRTAKVFVKTLDGVSLVYDSSQKRWVITNAQEVQTNQVNVFSSYVRDLQGYWENQYENQRFSKTRKERLARINEFLLDRLRNPG